MSQLFRTAPHFWTNSFFSGCHIPSGGEGARRTSPRTIGERWQRCWSTYSIVYSIASIATCHTNTILKFGACSCRGCSRCTLYHTLGRFKRMNPHQPTTQGPVLVLNTCVSADVRFTCLRRRFCFLSLVLPLGAAFTRCLLISASDWAKSANISCDVDSQRLCHNQVERGDPFSRLIAQ